jgi:hypothetical protein
VRLGVRDRGSWIRAGLAPYNTEEEIEGFIELLKRFVERPLKVTLTKVGSGARDFGLEHDKHLAEAAEE